jgi:nicotinamidase/pyrazinamidase
MPKKALLVVDLQNDFCPGGALGINDANKIIPAINRYISKFQQNNCLIIATCDWHPADSTHFDKRGGLWPVHCVAKTHGAEFHPDLKIPDDIIIVYKGTGINEDGYSAVSAKTNEGIGLSRLLRNYNVEEVYICGLATDYCVKFSTLDLTNEEFKVYILLDAIKAVNLKPDDEAQALEAMRRAGAVMIREDELDLNE